MNLLRTEKEAALNNLLVACRESADLHRDAAELTGEAAAARALRQIADERAPLIDRIERAVHSLGDLPSTPDADRETGEMLLNHLQASLSTDSTGEILRKRMNAEQGLDRLIGEARAAGLADVCGDLLDDLSHHIEQSRNAISGLARKHAG